MFQSAKRPRRLVNSKIIVIVYILIVFKTIIKSKPKNNIDNNKVPLQIQSKNKFKSDVW